MDDDFEFFLVQMGPAIERRRVSDASMARFRGKVPEQLLAYWEQHG